MHRYVEDLAYVVSEVSHTLSIIRLPDRFSKNFMGRVVYSFK